MEESIPATSVTCRPLVSAVGVPCALPRVSRSPCSHGPYEAEIVTVGACLRTLTRDGVDLVAGSEPGEMCRSARGAVLMPWPNRVADGAYDFGGRHLPARR